MHFLTCMFKGGGGITCVIDKLLCSHNEIRSTEAGPHFIYLIFHGFIFCNCSSFYFSCGWFRRWHKTDCVRCTETCSYVFLCGVQVCVYKVLLRLIAYRKEKAGFDELEQRLSPGVCYPAETDVSEEAILCDDHRKSKTPNQKTPVALAFHWAPSFMLIDNQWCWPTRAPCKGSSVSLYVLAGTNHYTTEASIDRPNIPQTFMAHLCNFNLRISHSFCSHVRMPWLPFILPSEAYLCIYFPAPSSQTAAHVYLLDRHSWGAQRRSEAAASYVLSFLFHVCLSEMAHPLRGLPDLCVIFFFPFCTKKIYCDLVVNNSQVHFWDLTHA